MDLKQILKLKTLIRLLNGDRKNMVTLQKIDEVAIKWNKTKDPKDKDEWYKLIKEMHGLNNLKRRTVSTDSCNKENVRGYSVDRKN